MPVTKGCLSAKLVKCSCLSYSAKCLCLFYSCQFYSCHVLVTVLLMPCTRLSYSCHVFMSALLMQRLVSVLLIQEFVSVLLMPCTFCSLSLCNRLFYSCQVLVFLELTMYLCLSSHAMSSSVLLMPCGRVCADEMKRRREYYRQNPHGM